jgi:hypothetical protein
MSRAAAARFVNRIVQQYRRRNNQAAISVEPIQM